MPTIIEVPLALITIKDRQRKEYGDLSGLASSIKKNGQLQNLLVEPADSTGRFALVAGGRRLAGIAAAGLTTAICKVHDGPLDDLTLQELELEENVQRKDLTMLERQNALAGIHAIKVKVAEKDGAVWTTQNTADLIGVSTRTIYNAIEIAKAALTDPEIAKADTAHGAMQRLTKAKDLRKREEAVQVRALAEGLNMVPKRNIVCYQSDALEGMKSLADESQDFVITNPPFGVDIEEVFTSDKKIYEDNPETISELCRQVWLEAYRVLRPDRWFVCFYPTIKLEECRDFLAAAGFKFQKVPAVWVKPNKRVGNVGDGTQSLVIGYEQFFFARKGNARFHDKSPTNNVFSVDTEASDRIHPLQMPPELWTQIYRLITLRGEVGVEPFSGSGSGGVAAVERDLEYKGFELDPDFVGRSNTWIQETIQGKAHASGLSIEIQDDKIPF
jgi:ParB/RepB/Spo0J family partition protein